MRKLGVHNANGLHCILKDLCIRSADFRALHRMHCVLLVGKGHSCYKVGEYFNYDPRTIERWVHYYNRFGIEGLLDDPKGRPAKIRHDYLKQIQKNITEEPYKLGYRHNGWDGKLLQKHIQRRYGIELSVRQCHRLLRKLRQQTPPSASLA